MLPLVPIAIGVAVAGGTAFLAFQQQREREKKRQKKLRKRRKKARRRAEAEARAILAALEETREAVVRADAASAAAARREAQEARQAAWAFYEAHKGEMSPEQREGFERALG